MNFKSKLVFWCSLFLVISSAIDARSILEKKMYYIKDNKIGVCKFWSLYLGNHQISLMKKFPGEQLAPLETSLNLSLVSSGYIEGHGFSDRGKVESGADFYFKPATGDSGRAVPVIDSIDFVAQYGDVTRLVNGEKGILMLDVEGSEPIYPKSFKLRIYKMVNEYGAESLRTKAEIPISGFSFTKAGIQRALKARK